MRIHVLQHVAFEGPAGIADWAAERGHSLTTSRLFESASLPTSEAFDMLVIMGGPMGANDDHRFAWMAREKALINAAVEAGKKVLGVCLGAQLMAAAAGARVFRNREKEIGWFPVELDPVAGDHPLRALSPRAIVFHWHGDTFDLPKGAERLAHSAACDNQAFRIGPHAIGLQFHIEVGAADVDRLLQFAAEDLTEGPFVQQASAMQRDSAQYAPAARAALYAFLEGLAS